MVYPISYLLAAMAALLLSTEATPLRYRRYGGYDEIHWVDDSDGRYPVSPYDERFYHAPDDDGREPKVFRYFRRNWPPPTYGGWNSQPGYGSSSDANSGGHNSWSYQQPPQAPRSGYNDYTQPQPGKSTYQKLSAHASRAKNFASNYMPGKDGYQKLSAHASRAKTFASNYMPGKDGYQKVSGHLNSNYFFWTKTYKDKKRSRFTDPM